MKGKAQACSFSKLCTREDCGQEVDYTEDIVKYVIISGIVDDDIKKDILSYTDLDSRSLNDTIALVESKEMAVRAMTSKVGSENSVAAASNSQKTSTVKSTQEKLAIKWKCRNCDSQIQRFKLVRDRGGKGKILKEFNLCKECWKQSSKSESTRPPRKWVESNADQTGALFDTLPWTQIETIMKTVVLWQ